MTAVVGGVTEASVVALVVDSVGEVGTILVVVECPADEIIV